MRILSTTMLQIFLYVCSGNYSRGNNAAPRATRVDHRSTGRSAEGTDHSWRERRSPAAPGGRATLFSSRLHP